MWLGYCFLCTQGQTEDQDYQDETRTRSEDKR